MSMDRPYRVGTTYARVKSELLKYSGTQFDPAVVNVFLGIAPEEWEEINHRVMDDLAARGLIHRY